MIDMGLKPRVESRRDPALEFGGRAAPAQRQLARVRVSAAMDRRPGVEVAS